MSASPCRRLRKSNQIYEEKHPASRPFLSAPMADPPFTESSRFDCEVLQSLGETADLSADPRLVVALPDAPTVSACAQEKSEPVANLAHTSGHESASRVRLENYVADHHTHHDTIAAFEDMDLVKDEFRRAPTVRRLTEHRELVSLDELPPLKRFKLDAEAFRPHKPQAGKECRELAGNSPENQGDSVASTDDAELAAQFQDAKLTMEQSEVCLGVPEAHRNAAAAELNLHASPEAPSTAQTALVPTEMELVDGILERYSWRDCLQVDGEGLQGILQIRAIETQSDLVAAVPNTTRDAFFVAEDSDATADAVQPPDEAQGHDAARIGEDLGLGALRLNTAQTSPAMAELDQLAATGVLNTLHPIEPLPLYGELPGLLRQVPVNTEGDDDSDTVTKAIRTSLDSLDATERLEVVADMFDTAQSSAAIAEISTLGVELRRGTLADSATMESPPTQLDRKVCETSHEPSSITGNLQLIATVRQTPYDTAEAAEDLEPSLGIADASQHAGAAMKRSEIINVRPGSEHHTAATKAVFGLGFAVSARAQAALASSEHLQLIGEVEDTLPDDLRLDVGLLETPHDTAATTEHSEVVQPHETPVAKECCELTAHSPEKPGDSVVCRDHLELAAQPQDASATSERSEVCSEVSDAHRGAEAAAKNLHGVFEAPSTAQTASGPTQMELAMDGIHDRRPSMDCLQLDGKALQGIIQITAIARDTSAVVDAVQPFDEAPVHDTITVVEDLGPGALRLSTAQTSPATTELDRLAVSIGAFNILHRTERLPLHCELFGLLRQNPGITRIEYDSDPSGTAVPTSLHAIENTLADSTATESTPSQFDCEMPETSRDPPLLLERAQLVATPPQSAYDTAEAAECLRPSVEFADTPQRAAAAMERLKPMNIMPCSEHHTAATEARLASDIGVPDRALAALVSSEHLQLVGEAVDILAKRLRLDGGMLENQHETAATTQHLEVSVVIQDTPCDSGVGKNYADVAARVVDAARHAQATPQRVDEMLDRERNAAASIMYAESAAEVLGAAHTAITATDHSQLVAEVPGSLPLGKRSQSYCDALETRHKTTAITGNLELVVAAIDDFKVGHSIQQGASTAECLELVANTGSIAVSPTKWNETSSGNERFAPAKPTNASPSRLAPGLASVYGSMVQSRGGGAALQSPASPKDPLRGAVLLGSLLRSSPAATNDAIPSIVGASQYEDVPPEVARMRDRMQRRQEVIRLRAEEMKRRRIEDSPHGHNASFSPQHTLRYEEQRATGPRSAKEQPTEPCEPMSPPSALRLSGAVVTPEGRCEAEARAATCAKPTASETRRAPLGAKRAKLMKENLSISPQKNESCSPGSVSSAATSFCNAAACQTPERLLSPKPHPSELATTSTVRSVRGACVIPSTPPNVSTDVVGAKRRRRSGDEGDASASVAASGIQLPRSRNAAKAGAVMGTSITDSQVGCDEPSVILLPRSPPNRKRLPKPGRLGGKLVTDAGVGLEDIPLQPSTNVADMQVVVEVETTNYQGDCVKHALSLLPQAQSIPPQSPSRSKTDSNCVFATASPCRATAVGKRKVKLDHKAGEAAEARLALAMSQTSARNPAAVADVLVERVKKVALAARPESSCARRMPQGRRKQKQRRVAVSDDDSDSSLQRRYHE